MARRFKLQTESKTSMISFYPSPNLKLQNVNFDIKTKKKWRERERHFSGKRRRPHGAWVCQPRFGRVTSKAEWQCWGDTVAPAVPAFICVGGGGSKADRVLGVSQISSGSLPQRCVSVPLTWHLSEPSSTDRVHLVPDTDRHRCRCRYRTRPAVWEQQPKADWAAGCGRHLHVPVSFNGYLWSRLKNWESFVLFFFWSGNIKIIPYKEK